MLSSIAFYQELFWARLFLQIIPLLFITNGLFVMIYQAMEYLVGMFTRTLSSRAASRFIMSLCFQLLLRVFSYKYFSLLRVTIFTSFSSPSSLIRFPEFNTSLTFSRTISSPYFLEVLNMLRWSWSYYFLRVKCIYSIFIFLYLWVSLSFYHLLFITCLQGSEI